MTKKVAVLLSGCGVYDGAEIHEAVFTLLALDEAGLDYQCVAPDIAQHHVVNHVTGEEMPETRNVLLESARIARGNILSLSNCAYDDFSALVIPGGFGAAKNLSKWAFQGPVGEVNEEVKRFILGFVNNRQPIVSLCVSPAVLAKALEGTGERPVLTLGTELKPSPYDIKASHEGIRSLGALTANVAVPDLEVDFKHKIITAPCYMMEVRISEVRQNIQNAISQLKKWLAD